MDVSQIKKQNSSLKNEIAELKATNESLSADIEANKTLLAEAENSVKESNSKLEAAQSELATANENLNASNEKVEGLMAEGATKQAEIEKMTADAKSVEEAAAAIAAKQGIEPVQTHPDANTNSISELTGLAKVEAAFKSKLKNK